MKNSKWRKTLAAGIAICIVAALSVGGSLSYLSQKTENKANTFSLTTPALLASLTEPSWDESKAANMLPGQTAPKDPLITNTSTGTNACSEWIAAEVSFRYKSGANAGQILSDVDLYKVLDVFSVDYAADNGGAWTRAAGNAKNATQVFVYNSVIAPGASTTKMFTTISCSAKATETELNAISAFGGFTIQVDGFAEQSTAFASSADFVSYMGSNSASIW